ncbi:MAG: UDP-N-acetylmuramate dehydrogenase [Minisyncoccia bacterium]|jgi:UDP-N-acetylmuramate dehydrogenase
MIKFRKNVKLAPLSTFGIGGWAEYFYEAETPDELIETITLAKKLKMPFRVFAGGSNVVFPDGKLKGLLIRFKGGKILVKKNTMIADAGVGLADVIRISMGSGLSGLETLSGIPGTLGGAIVGNAGAYGHSISEIVRRVEIWDPFDTAQGKRRWLKNPECRFAYRESALKHEHWFVLRAELAFKRGNKTELKKISRDIIGVRERKYKPGLRCPGSFFKNILVKDVSKRSLGLIDKGKIVEGKIPAGYVLEEVGAKGMRLGGIRIADFHGNLLINTGKAKAKDAKKLAKLLKERVKRKFGIKLEEEVRYF